MAHNATFLSPTTPTEGIRALLTPRHLDNMARVMLATGLIVAYGYFMEGFVSWYSGSRYEMFVNSNRATGTYRGAFYALLVTNVLIPQALWSARVRRSTLLLFLVALSVNVGMWLERFLIVVTSLHRDFLTSSWGNYWPTRWDWATFVGTIGLFVLGFLLFIRALPMISIAEVKELLHRTQHEEDPHAG